jgi:hypothetical protein
MGIRRVSRKVLIELSKNFLRDLCALFGWKSLVEAALYQSTFTELITTACAGTS